MALGKFHPGKFHYKKFHHRFILGKIFALGRSLKPQICTFQSSIGNYGVSFCRQRPCALTVPIYVKLTYAGFIGRQLISFEKFHLKYAVSYINVFNRKRI